MIKLLFTLGFVEPNGVSKKIVICCKALLDLRQDFSLGFVGPISMLKMLFHAWCEFQHLKMQFRNDEFLSCRDVIPCVVLIVLA